MSSVAPLKAPRLISLFLSFAFGVVGIALPANAHVKSEDQKKLVQEYTAKLGLAGASVEIDTTNIETVGYVVAAASACIAVVSLVAFILTLLARPSAKGATPFATRTLKLQAGLLALASVFLLAPLIAFTDFFVTRGAKVTATLAGKPIPPALVQTVQNSLGVTTVYKDIDYLRNAAILPWFAFLFGVASSVLLFLAAGRARSTAVAQDHPAASNSGEKLAA